MANDVQKTDSRFTSFLKLFGFELKQTEKKYEEQDKLKSFTPPEYDDGALTVSSGAAFGQTFIDIEGNTKTEHDLISRYREMSLQPELETAIEDIVNEAIVPDELGKIVELNLDNLEEIPDSTKDKITEEFDNVLRLLNFSNRGYDIFRRWYVDGRLFYHIIIEKDKEKEGVAECRYIDPRKIRKIREILRTKDEDTGAELTEVKAEYYVFSELGFSPQTYGNQPLTSIQGIRIHPDSISYVTSGLTDSERRMVLSYLHKAIKPLNMLRMVEDAMVIYRLSRAPERRIFYIGTGDMPPAKAKQYVYDTMVQYRNKLVYNATTGELKDDRKHMAILEDFWLPRRDDGKNTEVDTLPGGDQVGEIRDTEYFEKKLYRALNVPYSRFESGTGFSLGRSTEINRDEIRFSRFITRLRTQFSALFDDILRRQLMLKNIVSDEDEWEEIREGIIYDFNVDNNFEELKKTEILRERLMTLQQIENYVGKFVSKKWTWKNVLYFTDEEIEEMQKEIDEEKKTGDLDDILMGQQGGFGNSPFGQDDQPMLPSQMAQQKDQESDEKSDEDEKQEKVNTNDNEKPMKPKEKVNT